jgi:hypothetical protein
MANISPPFRPCRDRQPGRHPRRSPEKVREAIELYVEDCRELATCCKKGCIVKTTIRKIGNSYGVTIPKPLLTEVGAKPNDQSIWG